jgi:hypothetical protein
MIQRIVDGDSTVLAYDAENRLVSVCQDTDNDASCDIEETIIATFTYDGDGKRVISEMDGETILFVGAHYEVKNPGVSQEVTKYYVAGASRIGTRKYTVPVSMNVEYVIADHLGSSSLTTDANGVKISEMRYKAWGEVRFAWTNAPVDTAPDYELTKYTYTGQYSYMDDPTTEAAEGFGLMYYNARWRPIY